MRERRDSITPLGIVLCVLILGSVGLVYWRSTQSFSAGDTLLRLQSSGIVRIGYANEAPYGYLDSETGQITGEAPEIAKVILRRMGAQRIEPVVTEFGSLIPGLKADRFDVIAAGMYITRKRSQEIDFSNPSYAIGEAFLVVKGNPLDLHSFEDIAKHHSARLSVMGGSVEHGYAQALNVPSNRIVVFPDYPSAVAGLRTGRVDAVAATILTANDLLSKLTTNEVELAQPFHDPVIDGKPIRGYGAFGFRRQDDALRTEFNRHLADFLGTPEHLNLVKPFGFSAATLPGDVTAENIIAESRGHGD